MPDLPQPSDTSIATAPSEEAQLGSTTDTGAPAQSDRNTLTIGSPSCHVTSAVSSVSR